MIGLFHSLIASLAATLLHVLWQAALVTLLFVLWRSLARPSARQHYFGVCLTLASVPSLALFTFLRSYQGVSVAQVQANLADPEAGQWFFGALGAASSKPLSVTPAAALGFPTWGDRALVVGWALGACFLLLRQLGGALWLRRQLAARAIEFPAELSRRAHAFAEQLGVKRVRFVSLPTGSVPFAFGWLRAVVVVPAAVISGTPIGQLEMLLLHELMHLRRADYLVNFLQSMVECLFFFHPCVWWLGRVARQQRELACDAQVLALGTDPLAYARALTELEASRTPQLAVAARGPQLAQRVRAILRSPRPSRRPLVVSTAMLAVSLAVLAAACGHEGLDADEVAGSTPASGVAASATDLSGEAASPASTAADDSRAGPIVWLPADIKRHLPIIAQVARRESADAQLIALMILVESGGDPNAVSRMGARGLMQLMPTTADNVAARLGTAVSADALFDPATNIRLGARLIADLMAEHSHQPPLRQIELALAGYNAGESALRQHLQNGAPLPDETQRYTRLLVQLYRQRNADDSAAYRAWRARLHARWLRGAAHPLPDARLTSPFGKRVHPIEGSNVFHRGVDLSKSADETVRAPLAGKVARVGEDDVRGIFVIIEHKGALRTRYYHLASTPLVAGQSIARGTPIGEVGSTGKSTGPHLHFEVLDQGEPIDPAILFEQARSQPERAPRR